MTNRASGQLAASTGRGARWTPAGLALAALLVTGCGVDEIVHGLEEREANQILVVLESKDIQAQKEIDPRAGRRKGSPRLGGRGGSVGFVGGSSSCGR